MQTATLKQIAPAASAAPQPVVVTPLAYELLARASKARLLANRLHQAGLPSSDAERMTPSMWRAFHAGLRANGLLGACGTEPSSETIARTLDELRKLEHLIPVCGTAPASRLPEAA
jgi:hypothetical protein